MAANPVDEYCKLLGVFRTSSVNDIKRAYRRKAKELHPDRNKSSDAHEQFILLNEAYEYLLNLKEKKSKNLQPDYSSWKDQHRDKAREEAQKFAKMQFEEFKKTDYYKKSQAADTVIEHFYFFSAVLSMSTPFIGLLFFGLKGLLVGMLFAFLSVHYWAGIFKDRINIDIRSLLASVKLLIKTKTFFYSTLTILNLFLFFRITLNTEVKSVVLFALVAGIYLVVYTVIHFKPVVLKSLSKKALLIAWLPILFNLFFFINFIFSSRPATEKYSFVHHKEWYGGRYVNRYSYGRLEKVAYIHLEHDYYDEYHWYRMFFDFEAMQAKSNITYTFEEGLFGLRVLKWYEFS